MSHTAGRTQGRFDHMASPRMPAGAMVRPHAPAVPLRVGTRGSPLALWQTRHFLGLITRFCPVLRDMEAFREQPIRTSGDAAQDRSLAEIGGKGLFAKEIHDALAEGQVDFAVHSLKDLETSLPRGIVLACVLTREDPRDALILGPRCGALDIDDPFAAIPEGAVIGTSSPRRMAQLLAVRPDLRTALLRGNVQTRLARVRAGAVDASLLAIAGLIRMGMTEEADAVLDPGLILPAVGQGIIGITVRESDEELCALLGAIEDAEARIVATAERSFQATLDGSCRTPLGGYARLLPDGMLRLTGVVARGDGSFVLRREITGAAGDADRLGRALGAEMRADSPADVFA